MRLPALVFAATLSVPALAGPAPETIAVDRAQEALAAGDPRAAARILEGALPEVERAGDPDATSRVRCLLGAAQLRAGSPRAAERTLEVVPLDTACGRRAGFLRAEAMAADERADEAAALYESLGAVPLGDDRDGESAEALVRLARRVLEQPDRGDDVGRQLFSAALGLRLDPHHAATLARELADRAEDGRQEDAAACTARVASLAEGDVRADRLAAARVCNRYDARLLLTTLPDTDADATWLRGAVAADERAADRLREVAIDRTPAGERRDERRREAALASRRATSCRPCRGSRPTARPTRWPPRRSCSPTPGATMRRSPPSAPTWSASPPIRATPRSPSSAPPCPGAGAGRPCGQRRRAGPLRRGPGPPPRDVGGADRGLRGSTVCARRGRRRRRGAPVDEARRAGPGTADAERAVAALARQQAFDAGDLEGARARCGAAARTRRRHRRASTGRRARARIASPGRQARRPVVRIGARNLDTPRAARPPHRSRGLRAPAGSSTTFGDARRRRHRPGPHAAGHRAEHAAGADTAFDVPVPVGPGLYSITAASAEEEARALLLVSDLAVVARTVGTDVAVASFDADGDPVGRARVLVVQQGEVVEGQTDGSGLWTGQVPGEGELVVLAERGGSWALAEVAAQGEQQPVPAYVDASSNAGWCSRATPSGCAPWPATPRASPSPAPGRCGWTAGSPSRWRATAAACWWPTCWCRSSTSTASRAACRSARRRRCTRSRPAAWSPSSSAPSSGRRATPAGGARSASTAKTPCSAWSTPRARPSAWSVALEERLAETDRAARCASPGRPRGCPGSPSPGWRARTEFRAARPPRGPAAGRPAARAARPRAPRAPVAAAAVSIHRPARRSGARPRPGGRLPADRARRAAEPPADLCPSRRRGSAAGSADGRRPEAPVAAYAPQWRTEVDVDGLTDVALPELPAGRWRVEAIGTDGWLSTVTATLDVTADGLRLLGARDAGLGDRLRLAPEGRAGAAHRRARPPAGPPCSGTGSGWRSPWGRTGAAWSRSPPRPPTGRSRRRRCGPIRRSTCTSR
ncbi:MAG: hypothetical protein R3F59_19465 [Myxococcota bacterium]